METTIYDYIIIGSGFGGSVAAMRLAEKGYKVLVIEKGKRYESKDFPKTNWNIRKYLWIPLAKCFGFQQLSFFKEVFVLSGVGVGGGSLVYTNTLMVPPDTFFENKAWAKFKNWKKTLSPFYDKAMFMLGGTKAKNDYPDDELLKRVAEDMGKADSYEPVNVSVYYGDTEKASDPYFKGLGPQRTGCIECAGCMVGCRHNAKNTLDKNYLYFAEKFGAKVLPETEAMRVEFDDEKQQYHIYTQSSTRWFGKKQKVYSAKGLVVSGGVLGSMKLLLQQKHESTLPRLSNRLGENLRTNSESLCGVIGADRKLNNGVAISSIFNPDEHTHIELVKFPDKSGAMLRLGTLATGPGSPPVRIAKLLGNIISHPIKFLKTLFTINPAKNAVILLVMQTLDNSMKMVWKPKGKGGKLQMDNSKGGALKVPAYIESGQQVMHKYAEKVNGTSMNAITEIAFNMSSTAHILGGCPMGENAETGVVNDRFEVHGYPNMYILDGSIIPCNLGVNPSLTITALSEYAMAQVPSKIGNTRESLEELMEKV